MIAKADQLYHHLRQIPVRPPVRDLVGDLLRTEYQSPEYTTALAILVKDYRISNTDLRDILDRIERREKRKGKT